MAKQFVVYEVWTRSRVIEAESEAQALERADPHVVDGDLSLCNWHAVEVPQAVPVTPKVGPQAVKS